MREPVFSSLKKVARLTRLSVAMAGAKPKPNTLSNNATAHRNAREMERIVESAAVQREAGPLRTYGPLSCHAWQIAARQVSSGRRTRQVDVPAYDVPAVIRAPPWYARAMAGLVYGNPPTTVPTTATFPAVPAIPPAQRPRLPF